MQLNSGAPRGVVFGAGALYLLIIVAGLFGELGARAHLIVPGDAAQTAVNVLDSHALFLAGFAADAVMIMADVAVAVLLFVLFEPINRALSLLAAAFRLTQAAVLGANLLFFFAAGFALRRGGEFSPPLAQADATALWLLELHAYGYDFALLFFGLSNLFLGRVALQSQWVPRALGYGLSAAGIVYIVGSTVRFLAPDHLPWVEPAYALPLLVETGFCLWLLWRGARGGAPTGRGGPFGPAR